VFKETTMTSIAFVMSNARPGRERDYAAWYRGRHLADVLRTPGIVSGGFYEAIDLDPSLPVTPGSSATPRWRFAARYALDRPMAEVTDEVMRRAGGPEMPATDAIDSASVLWLAATALGPRVVVAEAQGAGAIWAVLGGPREGMEDAYNAWYDQHLQDVLATPGFTAAQRFKVAPETRGRPSPWSCLTIFEAEADQIVEAISEVYARGGTPRLPMGGVGEPGLYAPFRQIA